ncbi:MAG: hypothetical protein ISF22_03470 [Methanomassiliicoccus sp.]|nr:hypothetical protein [Methanomassiliicoccus sp.]
MLVRIRSDLSDPGAREMYLRFKDEGFCPFGVKDLHLGFVREATETTSGYVLTVDISHPAAIKYLHSKPQAEG